MLELGSHASLCNTTNEINMLCWNIEYHTKNRFVSSLSY